MRPSEEPMTTINTPHGPVADRRAISYDDYLRLLGLLTLAADHRRALEAITRSAGAITLEGNLAGHTDEAVWSGLSVDELLERLGITVAPRKE